MDAAKLLVRDVMTIGVPVCRDAETCGQLEARLRRLVSPAEVIVVLDEVGRACGWLTRRQVEAAPPESSVEAVMDEDIPNVPPDIPVEAAAQYMRDLGLEYLFLMHSWPGEPRPSAYVSLERLGRSLAPESEANG